MYSLWLWGEQVLQNWSPHNLFCRTLIGRKLLNWPNVTSFRLTWTRIDLKVCIFIRTKQIHTTTGTVPLWWDHVYLIRQTIHIFQHIPFYYKSITNIFYLIKFQIDQINPFLFKTSTMNMIIKTIIYISSILLSIIVCYFSFKFNYNQDWHYP